MDRESFGTRGSALLRIIIVIVIVIVIAIVVMTGIICMLYISGKSASDKHSQIIQQKAMFHSIEVGNEMFKHEFGYYPPSKENSLSPVYSKDPTTYGGANKLAEALVGWDRFGFHPESYFRADGQTVDASGITKAIYENSVDSVEKRKGPFIRLTNAYAFRMSDIYEPSVLKSAGFNPNNLVLCDVYVTKRHSGVETGMPILYYKANTRKTEHNVDDPDSPENIYNYKDNHILLSLGAPGKPDGVHPIFTNPKLFYKIITKDQMATTSRAYRNETYILISAGKDGLYGTDDDIHNFSKE